MPLVSPIVNRGVISYWLNSNPTGGKLVTIDTNGQVREATAEEIRTAGGLAAVASSGSATDLTTGTLADARLSSNVPLKNAASNVFTGSITSPRIYVSGSNPQLSPSTSDGADNRTLILMGGGEFGPTTRGPHITLAGLEAATRPGNIELATGLNGEIRMGGELGGGFVETLRIVSAGKAQFRNATWHGSITDGLDRVLYALNSTTYYKGHGTGTIHEWRNGSDSAVMTLSQLGNVMVNGTVQVGGASGNLLKNVTGGIQTRNSVDSAYVRLEANGVTNQVGNLLLQAGPTWNDGSQIIFQNGPTIIGTMQASGVSFNVPVSLSSSLTVPLNVWHFNNRTFFGTNNTIWASGQTGTALSHSWRNFTGSDLMQLYGNGDIVVNGTAQVGGGSGPVLKNFVGTLQARLFGDTGFTDFAARALTTTTPDFGSAATPANCRLRLGYASGSYLAGVITGRGYSTNFAYADVIISANPNGGVVDYSNLTDDLAIRGQTGNVEINRGRLVLADVALSQSWGLKTQFGAVSGQLDFINHTGSTRLSLYQDGRMWITGAVAAGTFSGLNITNITANAAGVKTQIRLPVFNSSEGGVIEEFGNSFDGYRLNISQAQGGPITFTTGGIESVRIDGANRTIFGVGTAYGKVNIYDGAAYIIQDQPVIWHSAGTIRSQIIGDSTNNLRFSTRVGGVLTENMVIASTGQVTVSQGLLQIGTSTGPILRTNSNGLDVRNSGNTDWGQLNVKEIRGDGLSYSRFAQMATAGSWGGGYNFNLNGGVANRDSTGTVAAVWYTTTGINWYAEPSAVAGAISPRLTLNSTLLSMNGSIQAQSASDTTKGLLCRNSGATGNALGQMMIGHPGWYDNQLLLMHDGGVVANMSSTFFIVQKAAQLLAGAAVTGQVSITGSNSINSGVFLSNMASTLGRTGRVLIGWPGNYDDQLLMYHGSTLFANISDSTVNFTRTVGVQNQSGTDTQIVNTNNGNNAINWSSTGVPGTRITALTDMRLAINYVDRVTLTNALFSVIPNATFGGTVQVGGASGHLLKRNVDELQIRDSTDAAWRDIQARVARFNSAGGQTLVINGTDIAGGGSYMYLTSGSTHLYLRTNAAASQPLTLINSTCIFAPNVWHGDSVNLTRFLFSGNGASYYKGFGLVPHEWRNAAESFIMRLSDTGDLTTLGYITSAFQSLSADPSTLDISSGMSRLVKNTTSGEIRWFVNDAGTIKKSAAFT